MNIEQTDNFIASLGFEAYRVGGSVRDEIIGREPKDADYMIRGVSLIDLFVALNDPTRRSYKVTDLTLRDGQHVGYRVGRPYNIEITLPRREESTGPGHGDFKIVVDPEITLEEDAQRRDFTFNALYFRVPVMAKMGSPWSDSIIDPTGMGLDHLQRRIISVTHEDSFRDDPLRILRALRFVARGYDLSGPTRYLMERDAASVDGLTYKHEAKSPIEKMDGGTIYRKRIPGDAKKEMTVMSGTVHQEMSNILMGTEVATALRIGRDVGVLGSLFPELSLMFGHDPNSNYHDLTTDEHTFRALEVAAKMDAPLEIRWALLFHDSGKPEVEWKDGRGRSRYYGAEDNNFVSHEIASEFRWRSAAKRMGVSTEMIEYVGLLIRHHMVNLDGKRRPSKVRRLRVEFGDRLLRDLIRHRACDIAGKNKTSPEPLAFLAWMESVREDAQRAGVPCTVSDLQVNGHDAIKAGLRGKSIGEALQTVLVEVAAQPTETTLSHSWQIGRLETLSDE